MNIHVFVHQASMDDICEIKSALATLLFTGELIMSKISDFATAQDGFNTRMEAALTGIGADIAGLNETILQLQSTSGAITAEDQAILDDLQAKGEALAAKFEAVDQLTPPEVPPVPAGV